MEFSKYINADPTATLRTIQQVEGEFGIKVYPLRPGESVIAIDTTAEDILWIKICNANGVPTYQKLKYTIEDTYNPNDSNYVSKKDFNELSAKLDKVLEELNNDECISRSISQVCT